MKILSIDTTNINCDVSVLDNDTLLSKKTTVSEQSHSSNLLPVLDSAMKESSLLPTNLDLVIANIGPRFFYRH